MNSLLTVLLSYLLLYKYWTLALVIFSAAVILPLPTNTMLLAVGAFASQGYFSFSLSLLVASAANILGDIFDYLIAKKYGQPVIRRLRERKFTYFKRAEDLISDHAGLAIFTTRFFGALGPIVNFLCGLAPISFQKFIWFDSLGNILDTLLFLLLGYFVGSDWQIISGFLGSFGGIAAIIILVLIIIGISRKKT